MPAYKLKLSNCKWKQPPLGEKCPPFGQKYPFFN